VRFRTLAGPLPIALLALITTAHGPAHQSPIGRQSDPVLTSLESELTRSVEGFAATGERAPYFLGYGVWDRQEDVVTAGAGVILVDRRLRNRLLDVDLRVGDHDLDNTRLLSGRGAPPPPPQSASVLPVDDDVDALRVAIWLRTDREYRTAVARLAQVQASLARTAAASDSSGDFSREDAHVQLDPVAPVPALDRGVWLDRLRRASARFNEDPDIHNAVMTLVSTREVRYVVNSDGTRVRTGDTRVRLMVTAETRTADGVDLRRTRTFQASSAPDLPDDALLGAAVDSMIADLAALRAAPEVEPYTGPAILSGRASAVFFHEILGHRVEGHRQKDEGFTQTFTQRVGESVMPSFISVVDDPTRREFGGLELAGHYTVDDEGVPARPVTIIDDGVLAGFLMGRSPIRAEPRSNGHGRREPGRRAVARQGNLFVTSSQAIAAADLRAKLIDEIRRQDKPYGYRFEEIDGGFTATGRTTPESFRVLPVLVYRVYADGRPDVLVRGADIVGTPLTVLGKIVATDDRPEVFSGMCGAESGSLPVSAVSPAVLVAELEIGLRAKSLERPPILAVPPDRPAGGAGRGGAAAGAAARGGAANGGGGGRGGGAQEDVLFRALSDEMARSMDSLRLDGLERPHFMTYRVEDGVEVLIDATFGAIVSRSNTRTRRLEADLRIGSPELDQTNFAEPGSRGLEWVEIGFDDDYGAIRRFAWRLTDARYKWAAEKLERKKAALEGRAAPDAPSFVADTARTLVLPPVRLVIDDAPWVELTRRVSAVFREYPVIEDSRTRMQVKHLNRYILASDGTRGRTPETSYVVLMSAIARGPAGTIRDYRVLAAPGEAGLGSHEEIVAQARALAEALTARVAAETIESYTGPVLLEGRAAPQIVHGLLGRHLGGTPDPIVPPRYPTPPQRRLEALVGQPVLPAGFDVTDDPTRAELAGVPLLGHYRLDDEGVAPRPVHAVEDGTLRAFLLSRIPASANDGSTGHGRDLANGELRPMTGNLILEAAAPRPAADLRAELLRLARERGLEYALVIRGFEDMGMLPPTQGASRARTELPPPTAVYRLWLDGREEPLRDVDVGEATMRLLRDIVAAGDEPQVYNFLQSGGTSFLRWGTVPISVVAPPLLVSELSLRKSESTEPRPVLAHPVSGAR